MSNFEQVKQRRDLKRALKASKNNFYAESDSSLTENDLSKTKQAKKRIEKEFKKATV